MFKSTTPGRPATYHPTADDLETLRGMMAPGSHEVLVRSGEEGLNGAAGDKLLARWLVARKGVMKAAFDSLTKHVEWRKTATPNGRIQEDTIKPQLAEGKVYLQGWDKNRRPVILGVGRNHHKFKTKEEAAKFCIYCLDAAVAIGDTDPEWDGKLTGVFDLRHLGLKNADTVAMNMMFDLLQNHYVERLGKLYLYEAPLLFYGLWKAAQPFIDPVTKTKITFVYHKDAAEVFSHDFDLHNIPKDIGGTGEFVGIDEAYRQAVSAAEARREQAGAAEAKPPATVEAEAKPSAEAAVLAAVQPAVEVGERPNGSVKEAEAPAAAGDAAVVAQQAAAV